MKKIVIFWNAGSGKSTFAMKLSEKLWIPAFYLDKELMREHRTRVDTTKEFEIIEHIIQQPTWITDWNYTVTFEQRVGAADTIIYLDISRVRCIWNAFWRLLKYKYSHIDRPDIWVNKESHIDFRFYKWIWDFNRVRKPKLFAMLEKHNKRLIVLHSHREVNNFIKSLP